LLSAAKRWTQARIEECERYLEMFQREPATWAEEIQQWIGRMKLRLTRQDLAVPVDMITPLTAESCQGGYARLQEFVKTFGTVLQCWPDLVSAVDRLRRNGYRVGACISGG